MLFSRVPHEARSLHRIFLLRWPPARSSSSSSCYCKYPVHPPRRAITTGHTTPHLLTPGPRARIKSCVAYLSDILETERAGCANEMRDCAQVLQILALPSDQRLRLQRISRVGRAHRSIRRQAFHASGQRCVCTGYQHRVVYLSTPYLHIHTAPSFSTKSRPDRYMPLFFFLYCILLVVQYKYVVLK